MLKRNWVAGLGNKNPEQGGQGIQVEDQGENKPAQKICKSQKGKQMAKSKKWIYAKKSEAF